MPEEPSEIEQEIAGEREHLAQHLNELESKLNHTVEHATDWHTYVSPKQLTIAASVAGACVLLAVFLIVRKKR